MASSQIEIANIAMGFLGEDAFQSLAEVSLRATQVNFHYEPAVMAMLGLADWHFAMQKVQLSQIVGTPRNEWQFRYQLPPQMARLSAVWPRSRYELYGTELYSDASALDADYVKRVPESNFPATFAILCGAELAVRCCMVVTGDKEMFDTLFQRVRPAKFAEALAADAQQRPNRRIEDAPFINCRS